MRFESIPHSKRVALIWASCSRGVMPPAYWGQRAAIGRAEGCRKDRFGCRVDQLHGSAVRVCVLGGQKDVLTADDVHALQEARDAGVEQPERVAADYFADPALQAIGSRYLRDNIKYQLGDQELAGLMAFYRYAAELDLVPSAGELRFYR